VRYLFSYLRAQVEHLTAEAGRGCGRVWRNNFKLGIVQTISERLKDQHETFEREARATAAAEGTTALVRVNTALAAMEAKTATVEAWTKEHMRLGTGRPSYFHEDGHARAAGRAAGHRVHLGGRARGALGSGQRQLN
jgi:hypothetical protein